MDRVPIPVNARAWNKRRRWLPEEYPEEYKPRTANLPYQEIAVPDTIDIRDSSPSEDELIGIGNQALDAPEQDGYGGAESLDIGVVFGGQQPGHVIPEGTYVNHGSLMCDRIAESPPGDRLEATYSTYYAMGPMLEKGFSCGNRWTCPSPERIHMARESKTQEYVDQDILDGFAPSRIPSRVAFELAPTRAAVGRAISDLPKAKPNEPPAMIEIALNDSRYTAVPRVRSALAIKRKGIDSYEGMLCVRGDAVPLQTTAFASSPNAHRCAAKLICAIASPLLWAIRAVGISQAFLKSPNLNPEDRVIVIPPPMIHLPWPGKLPPMNRDVSEVARNR